MVVTAIFVILSGVVLANNSRFGNLIVLQNLAHDIALTIRQAQIYGIAVKRCDPTATPLCPVLDQQFDVSYGTHFTPGETTFELFVDLDDNAAYDPGETVLASTITAGYAITDVCVTNAITSNEDCDLSALNIAFRRPEPDACIEGAFDADGECISPYGRASIVVQSNRGDEIEITVESSGQISVQ